MSQMKVKVTESNRGGKKSWSGTVSYPGLSGKLTKSDNTTAFSSEAGVKAAAQRLGERLKTTVAFEGKPALKAAAKKKASKSAKKPAKKSTPSTGSSPAGTGCPYSGNNW